MCTTPTFLLRCPATMEVDDVAFEPSSKELTRQRRRQAASQTRSTRKLHVSPIARPDTSPSLTPSLTEIDLPRRVRGGAGEAKATVRKREVREHGASKAEARWSAIQEGRANLEAFKTAAVMEWEKTACVPWASLENVLTRVDKPYGASGIPSPAGVAPVCYWRPTTGGNCGLCAACAPPGIDERVRREVHWQLVNTLPAERRWQLWRQFDWRMRSVRYSEYLHPMKKHLKLFAHQG